MAEDDCISRLISYKGPREMFAIFANPARWREKAVELQRAAFLAWQGVDSDHEASIEHLERLKREPDATLPKGPRKNYLAFSFWANRVVPCRQLGVSAQRDLAEPAIGEPLALLVLLFVQLRLDVQSGVGRGSANVL